MLALILNNAMATASRTAENAALGAGAGFMMVIGLGFLTLAAWLFLISVTTALSAALILGAAYFGIGMVLMAVMSAKSRAHKRRKAAAAAAAAPAALASGGGLTSFALALLAGITAGQKARF